MTAQKSLGRKFSSLLATGTAALLAAGGLVLAPTAAFAADEPAVTVSVAEADADGLDLTVDVAGITLRDDPAQVPDTGKADQGVYVAVVKAADRDSLAEGSEKALVADFAYKAFIADGAVTRNITVPADKILENADYKQAYKVVSWRAHGNMTPERYLAEADFNVTAAQYNALSGAEPSSGSAAITEVSKNTVKVTFDLANIVWPAGAYVSVYEAGAIAGLGHDNMGAGTNWVTPAQFTDGAATSVVTLSTTDPIPGAAPIDRSKTYEFVAWQGHTNPSEGTIFFQGPLPISDAQWDIIDPQTGPEPKPLPFTDVKQGDKFYKDINWLYQQGITTGVKQADGTYKYEPKWNITREATAAYLYRLAGKPAWSAPKTSPFADLKTSDPFYKEITWLANEGITTGVKQASGKPKFLPKSQITREAMAAFVYRYADSPKFSAPNASPFADLKKGDKFYKEITWAVHEGITTGIKQPSGKPKYEPKWNITREAMAAFLYRLEN